MESYQAQPFGKSPFGFVDIPRGYPVVAEVTEGAGRSIQIARVEQAIDSGDVIRHRLVETLQFRKSLGDLAQQAGSRTRIGIAGRSIQGLACDLDGLIELARFDVEACQVIQGEQQRPQLVRSLGNFACPAQFF